jgi:hypothetical protein
LASLEKTSPTQKKHHPRNKLFKGKCIVWWVILKIIIFHKSSHSSVKFLMFCGTIDEMVIKFISIGAQVEIPNICSFEKNKMKMNEKQQ